MPQPSFPLLFIMSRLSSFKPLATTAQIHVQILNLNPVGIFYYERSYVCVKKKKRSKEKKKKLSTNKRTSTTRSKSDNCKDWKKNKKNNTKCHGSISSSAGKKKTNNNNNNNNETKKSHLNKNISLQTKTGEQKKKKHEQKYCIWSFSAMRKRTETKNEKQNAAQLLSVFLF